MSFSRIHLQQHLALCRVSKSETEKLMADLEGHFKQAEAGRFIFGTEPDEAEAKRAIELATGKKAAQVVFVPMSQSFSEKPRAGDRRKVIRVGLGEALQTSLSGRFVGRLQSALGCDERDGAGLGCTVWDDTRSCFGLCLKQELEDSLKKGVWLRIGLDLASFLWHSLEVSLDYRLGFTWMDGWARTPAPIGQEEILRIAPLVRFMAQHPILGEKAGEPGVWLAIKA